VEANSTGGQGSRRAVVPSDDDEYARYGQYQDGHWLFESHVRRPLADNLMRTNL
jgi:hypothetical protein